MDRRRFLLTSLAGAVAAPLAAGAQQAGKVYRIGMLETRSTVLNAANLAAFRHGGPELVGRRPRLLHQGGDPGQGQIVHVGHGNEGVTSPFLRLRHAHGVPPFIVRFALGSCHGALDRAPRLTGQPAAESA